LVSADFRSFIALLCRVLVVNLLLFSSLTAAPAQEARRALLVDHPGVGLAQRTERQVVETLDLLRQQADESGTARMIVGIRTAFAPEGALSATTVARQRKEIAAMQSEILDRISSLGDKSHKVKRFSMVPFLAIEADAFELEQLVNMPEVISIEEDKPVPPTLTQSVPVVAADLAWSGGYTGSGQVLAVLDTGVDGSHPFLSGKVVSEACYSTNDASYGASSVCPSGVTASTASGSAMPYAGTCPNGECDHGTHVAGIMAGKGGGTTGVSFSGVAKEAALIAVQVFTRFDNPSICGAASPCVLSFTSDQIRGLERVYALRNTYDIAAVNMSLGGGRYNDQASCDSNNPSIKTAIDTLRSVGIATVIASGNNGYTDSLSAPGCVSTAVSVGATWDASYPAGIGCSGGGGDYGGVDEVACFSNSNDFLDLLAPGIWISSSIPGGGYRTMAGTSMATPHVAGAWAILKQQNNTLSVTQALNALKDSGLSVVDNRNGVVKPRIDVDLALDALSPPVVTVPDAPTIGTAVAGDGEATVSFTPPADAGGTSIDFYAATSSPGGVTGTCSSSPCKVTGLTNGTSYSFTVRAHNSEGYSAASASSNSVTPVSSSVVFGEALDDTELAWSSGGGSVWFAQSNTSINGGNAAQSGVIGHSQSSYIETSVTGPGTLSFYWRVSSESGYDYLRFLFDGVEQTGAISGESGWIQQVYTVDSGVHTLRWTYDKDFSVDGGSDAGWLDSVTFIQGSEGCPHSIDPVIDGSVVYSGTEACEASVSITTGPTVTIATGADVVYKAPVITLGTGFTVRPGAQFKAGASVDTKGY
jgi:subtilisin family serine protease